MATSVINQKPPSKFLGIFRGWQDNNNQMARIDSNEPDNSDDHGGARELEKRLKLKVDLRLCTIGGLLCSLNLIDSGIISSAAVTSMLSDLQLDQGNRYSLSILIFTVSSVCFQLPATIAVRLVGPRIFFTIATICFGLITLATAFIHTWKQMIILRVLLGISMSGIYPGLALLISSWYRREEQQLRFAYLQAGEVIILATGNIVNFGNEFVPLYYILNNLHDRNGLKGWQWMFLVQGLIACVIGMLTYFWVVDFPENAEQSFYFLDKEETKLAVERIQQDRGDVLAAKFSWHEILPHFLDPKIYAFAVMFFLLNIVSTSLAYFLPIILQSGMGFSENKAILLAAPPYYYAVIPVLISSRVGDVYRLRAPIISFNSICLIIGFALLGFAKQEPVRYIGVFLATGAYISNWAALNSYQANNITGQWKRVVTASAVTACNGLGGVAGSFIVRANEAPRYISAISISIGSHIVILGIVGVFTVYFFYANRRQRKFGKLIEKTEGFRYTY